MEIVEQLETWREQIGPFSHKMLDELEKMGIFPIAINVADHEYDPFIPESEWRVRLQLQKGGKLGRAISIRRSFIEDSEPDVIAKILYRVHTTRYFNPLVC